MIESAVIKVLACMSLRLDVACSKVWRCHIEIWKVEGRFGVCAGPKCRIGKSRRERYFFLFSRQKSFIFLCVRALVGIPFLSAGDHARRSLWSCVISFSLRSRAISKSCRPPTFSAPTRLLPSPSTSQRYPVITTHARPNSSQPRLSLSP
jgi:hypothetical protein